MKFFLAFAFLLIGYPIFSQERDFITGTIIDAKSGEPIVFANIHLENRDVGVISNADGGFRIPESYREMGDVLVISSMGYQTKRLSIFDVQVLGMNIIRLSPALIELSEAIVKPRRQKKLSAREIVKKAIDGILENYPTRPYSQVGYYRDYQLDKSKYVNLNEAILEVFDQGFKAVDSSTTMTLLYDYQENTDFKRDSLSRRSYNYGTKDQAKIIEKAYLPAYGGNEFTILNVHNAIRNYSINSFSFVHRFEKDFLKSHKFSKIGDARIDDEELYKIAFSKTQLYHSAYGTLYISKHDFSIYKMEYALYDDSVKSFSGHADMNGKKTRLMMEVITAYRPHQGKMYLSYISLHNNFKVFVPPKLYLEYAGFMFGGGSNNSRNPILYQNIDNRENYIVLNFSSVVDRKSASKLKNYRAKFLGEKIAFERLEVFGKKVYLYPKTKTRVQQQMIKDIAVFFRRNSLNNTNMTFDIKNVKDMFGNRINDWKEKEYNQFREFFVQKVKPDTFRPVNGSFMNKDKPIYEDQPTAKPPNFDEYWMNTPLKKVN